MSTFSNLTQKKQIFEQIEDFEVLINYFSKQSHKTDLSLLYHMLHQSFVYITQTQGLKKDTEYSKTKLLFQKLLTEYPLCNYYSPKIHNRPYNILSFEKIEPEQAFLIMLNFSKNKNILNFIFSHQDIASNEKSRILDLYSILINSYSIEKIEKNPLIFNNEKEKFSPNIFKTSLNYALSLYTEKESFEQFKIFENFLNKINLYLEEIDFNHKNIMLIAAYSNKKEILHYLLKKYDYFDINTCYVENNSFENVLSQALNISGCKFNTLSYACQFVDFNIISENTAEQLNKKTYFTHKLFYEFINQKNINPQEVKNFFLKKIIEKYNNCYLDLLVNPSLDKNDILFLYDSFLNKYKDIAKQSQLYGNHFNPKEILSKFLNFCEKDHSLFNAILNKTKSKGLAEKPDFHDILIVSEKNLLEKIVDNPNLIKSSISKYKI